MKIHENKTLSTTALILLLAISAFTASISTANAQGPTRDTRAYLSVNPHLLGTGQQMTVNLWIYPSPTGPQYQWISESFQNITITFTKPDGTKDSFMPLDGSGGTKPGESELIGGIWFLYTPSQIGNWNVQFTFPGQTFVDPSTNATVYYKPATSQTVAFTVQKDSVQIGVSPAPLPTGYWTRPINTDNREWYQISGDWLLPYYDGNILYGSNFNPYSKAPNSPHIIWKRQTSLGGLIGGPWGSMSYDMWSGAYSGGGGNPPVIMDGRIFWNMPGNVFHCVDLRTGQLIYQATGNINAGQRLVPSAAATTPGQTQTLAPIPYLWQFTTTTWTKYEAFTGSVAQSITNVGGVTPCKFFEGESIFYCLQQTGWNTTKPYRLAQNNLIKWDYSKVVSNNWMTGVIWNVSLKQPDGSGPAEGNRGSGFMITPDHTIGMVASTGEGTIYGFDLSTGAQIYAKNTGFLLMSAGYQSLPNGLHYNWDCVNMKVHAIDIKTGTEAWVSDVVGEYPWGSQNSMLSGAFAYGNIYMGAYDGYVYAMDYTSGKLKWKFFVGNTTETVFGAWALYPAIKVGDGKVYAATSEHTPTQPRIRGNRLFCIDAYTGKGIWNISGALEGVTGGGAIADGYLVGSNENDGMIYCFGKGQTATTISAPNIGVQKGTSVLIQGSVTDQSPGQLGTPAIADESMTEWMDYLHMQKAMPSNVKGVPVALTATAPDGSNINVGVTTTNGYGNFYYDWTPPSTGMYKVQAAFAGSESYWSSTAETAVSVKAAVPSASVTPSVTPPASPSSTSASPSATTPSAPTAPPSPSASAPTTASPSVAPPPSTEAAPSMMLYIAIAAAVIVIVVVAAALVLKRRK